MLNAKGLLPFDYIPCGTTWYSFSLKMRSQCVVTGDSAEVGGSPGPAPTRFMTGLRMGLRAGPVRRGSSGLGRLDGTLPDGGITSGATGPVQPLGRMPTEHRDRDQRGLL